MPKPHQFFEHVRRDWHPSLAALRIKILLRTLDDSDAPIFNPTPSSIPYLDVAQPETGDQPECAYVVSDRRRPILSLGQISLDDVAHCCVTGFAFQFFGSFPLSI